MSLVTTLPALTVVALMGTCSEQAIASIGLTFYAGGGLLPTHYANGAFVGQNGSWNRRPFNGYKVMFVPFANGRPSGLPEDVLMGLVSANDEAYGRPLAGPIDRRGALLVGIAVTLSSDRHRSHLQRSSYPGSIDSIGEGKRSGKSQ